MSNTKRQERGSMPDQQNKAPHSVLKVDPRDWGDNKSDARLHTEVAISPIVRAAGTARAFAASGMNVDITEAVSVLKERVTSVNGGSMAGADEMLVAQAGALDAIFAELANRAVRNFDAGYLQAGETFLRQALKAQSQCRATWESLSAIKNPPIFARQANINNGGQQQVNNGAVPVAGRSGAPVDAESTQTELLEESNGQRLDSGAQSATGRAHPELAPVGAVDRPQDGAGQRPFEDESLSRRNAYAGAGVSATHSGSSASTGSMPRAAEVKR